MNGNEKRSVLAGLYGNALEWYDFLLYASFAPIFADIFFPTKIHFVSLIATFSLFAIGFIMRPIGGLLLGHYADNAGRRKALILSMCIMTVSTSLIAVLPDFHSWGILAPVLFSTLRLIQGLAVGGELPGSTTYLIEHMFKNRRGLAGSLVLSSAFLGIFIGALTASMISTVFNENFLYAWGWRLPYLLGGLLGILGIYLRVRSVESPSFLRTVHSKEIPAKVVFTRYRKPLVISILITSILALSNYVLIAYLNTYLVNTENFLLKDALLINLIALALLTVLIPFMGYLSDIIGRKPIFMVALILLLILIFPVFHLLLSDNWWKILLSELILAMILAPINATVPTIIAEMFPTQVRASGISISYNIAQAVFGGTMPLISLTLINLSGNNYAPAWYVFVWCIIVLAASYNLTESYKNEI